MKRYDAGYKSAIDALLSDQIYLEAAIRSFDGDPPDNQFQAGYLDGLKTVKVYLKKKAAAIK